MKLLDTVLCFRSRLRGKSEVRTYMASLTEEQCRRDFGMGPTLQLDDYPYVHLMHCIDDELQAARLARCLLPRRQPALPRQLDVGGSDRAAQREDYAHLITGSRMKRRAPPSFLFDRLDAAHKKFGLPDDGRCAAPHSQKVAACVESEARRGAGSRSIAPSARTAPARRS